MDTEERLHRDLEGFLNDFESGITSKDKTIVDLGVYLIERCNVYSKSVLKMQKKDEYAFLKIVESHIDKGSIHNVSILKSIKTRINSLK